MARHPAFLIVRAKVAAAAKALAHMEKMNLQQKSLAATNPSLYSKDIHAESMATNVQGIYTQFESILKSLTSTIDGFTPSGESSHRDLLLQASASDKNRGAMIGDATLHGLSQILRFRHAVRNDYANELRHADVFENVELTMNIAPVFFADLAAFIDSFDEVDGGGGDRGDRGNG